MKTKCSVTLSANAGVSVIFKKDGVERRIWIDAAHRGKIVGFSTIYNDLWNEVKADEHFASPDVIFFTHCHGDHFSKRLAEEAIRMWPKAHVLLPEDRLGTPGDPATHPVHEHLISGHRVLIKGASPDDLSLDIVRVPHEGARFANVPHYGIFLSFGGVTVFASGDCELATDTLLPYLEGRTIDLAILAFPWITLQRGRKYLEAHMQPRHILACHLPFEEDDVHGYRPAAVHSAGMLPGMEVRVLDNPLQTEEYEF